MSAVAIDFNSLKLKGENGQNRYTALKGRNRDAPGESFLFVNIIL